MTRSTTYDGVSFGLDTDFSTLARQALVGAVGNASPFDHHPTAWLFRAYQALPQQWADRLSEAVASCVIEGPEVLRLNGLMFFSAHPKAVGAKTIVRLAREAAGDFTGDGLWELFRCVGAFAMQGDTDALALGKQECLRDGGMIEALIAPLTQADPDWVVENAGSIVSNEPKAGLTILFNLQEMGRDILELGEQLAPLAKKDRQFKKDLPRFIDDPNVVEAIMKAAKKRKVLH